MAMILYLRTDTAWQGATVCDEYYDARMKAFWRALADESERSDETEELVNEPIHLQPLESVKAKPKALAR